MSIKQILATLIFALTFCLTSYASKAYTRAVKVIQKDGSQLTLYNHGDEHCHWLSTADGVLLVQKGKDYLIAEIDNNGTLRPTSLLAHEPSLRNQTEKELIAQQNNHKELFYNHTQSLLQAATTRSIGSATPPYFTHTGTPKVLVILVEFPDCKFQARGEEALSVFDYFLNATFDTPVPTALTNNYAGNSYGSVQQYFTDISQGQFCPKFDVKGPVEVSKSYTYYGKDNSYSEGSDTNHRELVKEACKLVSSQVNMQDYDNNGDGYADLIYIIYAGYGQNTTGNSADCLWPKCGVTYDNTKYNGIQVRRYGINNELNFTPDMPSTTNSTMPSLTGIGVFCHEFSHAMGLPDLYAFNYTYSADNMAMEDWDLMDGGEYCNDGYTPAPYSAWELAEMGWASPKLLNSTPQQMMLQPISTANDFYKIEGENSEYLLLQNVQKKGWWKDLPHHGLLIQRIDYPYDYVNTYDNPNNNEEAPAVTIVPADGTLISSYSVNDNLVSEEEYEESYLGDPFPGSTERHELTSVRLNRSTLSRPLYNIQETEEGIITFDYLEDFATSISPIHQETGKKKIYSLDGHYLGTELSKQKEGIYIIGNKKKIHHLPM